jgi:uroporphyrinogen decarboxylase
VQYDELGIGRRFTGLYHEMVHHPLAGMQSVEELDRYPWPDLTDPTRVSHLRPAALATRDEGKAVAVMGSWGGSTGVFELSWYMRGMERFLIDLVDNRVFAEALLDRQLELHKTRWSQILGQVGDLTDLACTGDDLATQSSLLVSPGIYRDVIKPRQRALIQHIKSLTTARLYYHSCGAVEPLIDDLIEIGVDVLDPIQPASLDTRGIKKRYGERLSFFGGVDVQEVLPRGTPDQVRAEVRRRFGEMGEGGGLILGPSHWIQVDTPWENIVALYRAIGDCRY